MPESGWSPNSNTLNSNILKQSYYLIILYKPISFVKCHYKKERPVWVKPWWCLDFVSKKVSLGIIPVEQIFSLGLIISSGHCRWLWVGNRTDLWVGPGRTCHGFDGKRELNYKTPLRQGPPHTTGPGVPEPTGWCFKAASEWRGRGSSRVSGGPACTWVWHWRGLGTGIH
jgi:hypothetical protein